MGLFGIFKKNPITKCSECFRPIDGYIWNLHNKNYCQECYNRRVAITQQIARNSPKGHHSEAHQVRSNSQCEQIELKKELIINECCPPSHVGEQEFGFSLIQSNTGWHLLVKWAFAKPGNYTQYKEEIISLPIDIFEVYNTMELLCGYLYSISPCGSYFPKGYGNWKDRNAIEQLLIPTTT